MQKSQKILQTGEVLLVNKLGTIWVNGELVQSGFLAVGHDGSNRAFLPPFADPVTMTEGVDGLDPPLNHDLVQLTYSAGHMVGNHTNTHHSFMFSVFPVQDVENEIAACEQKILASGIPALHYFRAPYLALTRPLDGEEVVRTGAHNRGYELVWGSTHEDWETPRDQWQAVAADIVNHMKKWNTKANPRHRNKPNIVILHDAGPPTARHLGEIVEYVRENGFVLADFDPENTEDSRSYYLEP